MPLGLEPRPAERERLEPCFGQCGIVALKQELAVLTEEMVTTLRGNESMEGLWVKAILVSGWVDRLAALLHQQEDSHGRPTASTD